MQQDTSSRNQAANDMESLIPEYRSTLARMKKQVDELHSKLEDACCERDSLQQQVCPIVQPVSPHMLLFVQLSLPCVARCSCTSTSTSINLSWLSALMQSLC